MTTPSSVLAGETLRQRSLVGYGSQDCRVRYNLSNWVCMHTPLHMNLQVANFQCVITLTLLEHFFKSVDRITSGKEPEHAINTSHEWNCSLCSISCCWPSFSSTISLLSLLLSVTLLARPLTASPCMPAVVLYFTRYCTVRLKLFYFLCLIFVYYLCEEYYKPITVQYYIAACVSWVPKQTLLDLWTNWT